MKLIHDITPARTNWERYYAVMEYKRIGWHILWNPATYIDVVTPSYQQALNAKKQMEVTAKQMGWTK